MPETKYSGYLGLDWFNRDKAVITLGENDMKKDTDQPVYPEKVPAPALRWVNEDGALFYEIEVAEGKGSRPYWVSRDDFRVKEPRHLVLQKSFQAVEKTKKGELFEKEFKLVEVKEDDPAIENMLIKGDNLLALNTLTKMFEGKQDADKVKCIYIDPPFNTGQAFVHYDDNLTHSEWLTLMRDRLVLLKRLLSDTGLIAVHLDSTELGYATLLLNGIFGEENQIAICAFQQGAATGHKSINPGPLNNSNFVLLYSKSKETWAHNRVFKARDRDKRYTQFIKNRDRDCKEWEFVTLSTAFAEFDKTTEGPAKEEKLHNFVIQNADCVVQLARPDYEGVGREVREMIDKSKAHPEKVFLLKRENNSDMYFLHGQRILFYSGKVKKISGQLTTVEPITTIWNDLLSNNLHNEGDVSFPKGKKPESLLARIIELTTNPGDLVLDCFAGSGTTCAVAQKMGRKYIGVEIGDHADTHIIPRLKKVLSGEDQSGVSKAHDWHGGGAFKYYHLGPSVLSISDGLVDLNWKLPVNHISRALLYYFDYMELAEQHLPYPLGARAADEMAVVILKNPAETKNPLITELELSPIIAQLRKGSKELLIITNCGLQLPQISGLNIFVKKVPTELVVDLV